MQCLAEAMNRNKAAGFKNSVSTNDQHEVCEAEAYLSAKTFRTADNGKQIDLMIRACLRNTGALYAVMFGPTAARQEMVKQMAFDQCRKEVAETYRKVK